MENTNSDLYDDDKGKYMYKICIGKIFTNTVVN